GEDGSGGAGGQEDGRQQRQGAAAHASNQLWRGPKREPGRGTAEGGGQIHAPCSTGTTHGVNSLACVFLTLARFALRWAPNWGSAARHGRTPPGGRNVRIAVRAWLLVLFALVVPRAALSDPFARGIDPIGFKLAITPGAYLT